MTDIKDGGPAFPRIGEGFGNPSYDAPGMSLRDYFAAAVLRGWVQRWSPGLTVDALPAEWFSRCAYHYADAMLKARESRHE